MPLPKQFPTIFVIFGTIGSLSRKKLIPAIFYLHKKKLLPPLFGVVGFARRPWTHKEYQKVIADMVQKEAGASLSEAQEFSRVFSFQRGNFEDASSYTELAALVGFCDKEWKTCANKLFYLACPPEYYEIICKSLAASHVIDPCSPKEGWTRVVIEKPFGRDLKSAEKLDTFLGSLFREEQIYRMDHYLGKETVQNILAFRFTNSLFTPAWNKENIDSMTIQLFEKEGIVERGAYYDSVGALRDVGQNHLLQLLALFTMDNPLIFDAQTIRMKRAEILQTLKPFDAQGVVKNTVRAQYRGYTQVADVAKNSHTETYFRIKTELQTDTFAGVPLYLESGKAMHEDFVQVTVEFKHPLSCMCPKEGGGHVHNVLRYHIQPHERIAASFWVKRPGQKMVVEEKDFSFDYRASYEPHEFVEAYEKLLLDAIAGNQTLFVSTSEVRTSWRFIDSITRVWEKGKPVLAVYDAHTRPKIPEAKKRSTLPSMAPKKVKEIGYIGLGKMGMNMATRLMSLGWRVVGYNRTSDKIDEAQERGAIGAYTLHDLAGLLNMKPRLIFLMVPHTAVDGVLKELLALLSRGDVVIDGGNSYFKDSVQRGTLCEKRGIHFLDAGVSGGPSGAFSGACVMVGGDKKLFKKYEHLFEDISAPGAYAYMGAPGAGHFVKMVHNGIEYGMMQALGEGFDVLQHGPYALDVARIADIYNRRSVIESRLVAWLKRAYEKYGSELTEISGKVDHSGEGQWTVKTANELGIPVPIIQGALQFRVRSHKKPSYTGKVVSALRNQFGGHEVK